MYIWQNSDWPVFRWNSEQLLKPLSEAHLKQGRFIGQIQSLGFDVQLRTELQAITEETVKSSEIEGEILNPETVRSSVARRLGVPEAAAGPQDRRVEGMVEMLIDATKNYRDPLTRERLFRWQTGLFPSRRSDFGEIRVGTWRDDAAGPMQVVSSIAGRDHVYFEAPPAHRIDAEMDSFLTWFNQVPTIDGIIHAAITHLWFVTIHPFQDGNGRIARALADMSLARSEDLPHRFYSLAAQIRIQRQQYYGSLEATQHGDLDITPRLLWFTDCFSQAIGAAEKSCSRVLRKARFWQQHRSTVLNARQKTVLNRYLDGFDGKLTAKKWAVLAKTSMPTAQRDIKELVEQGVLIRNEGGSKNTSYAIPDEAGQNSPGVASETSH
jgi:Fic family protein